MFVNINGDWHYQWRAINHEGEVPASFVTKTLDRKAALKFLEKPIRKLGQPTIIVTDLLQSRGAALMDIGASNR